MGGLNVSFQIQPNKKKLEKNGNNTVLTINIEKFSNFSPVQLLRSVYRNAYAALLHVERKDVRPILGFALYDRLRTGTSTGIYATLLNDYVMPIIVYRTLAKLAVTNSVIFNRQNTLTNFDNRQGSESRGSFSADLERIKLFVTEMETSADEYITELTPYLEANASNFDNDPGT